MANERQRGNDIGSTGETVAANIARVRKSQQISLAELSERLAKRGHRISISGLSKIENGERRIDVDDLVAIALCLDVGPLGLLLPRGSAMHDGVPVTGGRGSAALVWKWAYGADSLTAASQGQRSFTARSTPDWISEVEPDLEPPKPRPRSLELGWGDGDGPIAHYETHRYSDDGPVVRLSDV